MITNAKTHSKGEKKEILRVLTQYIKNVVADDTQQIEMKISNSTGETIIELRIKPTS